MPVKANKRSKPAEIYFLDASTAHIVCVSQNMSKFFAQIAERLKNEMAAGKIKTKAVAVAGHMFCNSVYMFVSVGTVHETVLVGVGVWGRVACVRGRGRGSTEMARWNAAPSSSRS